MVKYSMAEIEYERRNGYRWYVDRPARLLDGEYSGMGAPAGDQNRNRTNRLV